MLVKYYDQITTGKHYIQKIFPSKSHMNEINLCD